MEKRCTRCREQKPLEAFARNRLAPDGRTYECRECRSRRHLKTKEQHYEERRLAIKDYRRSIRVLSVRLAAMKAALVRLESGGPMPRRREGGLPAGIIHRLHELSVEDIRRDPRVVQEWQALEAELSKSLSR